MMLICNDCLNVVSSMEDGDYCQDCHKEFPHITVSGPMGQSDWDISPELLSGNHVPAGCLWCTEGVLA